MKKGSKMSEESKAKMKASWCYEKHFTLEMRQKLSESHKGKVFSPETRQKLSQALQGKTKSESHKQRMAEVRTGKPGHPHTEEFKQMISKVQSGRVFSPKSLKLMSQAKKEIYLGMGNPFFGKHHTAEALTKILQNRRYLRPNKPEQRLIALMSEKGLPYRYVGDGQFILGGKCPDFLNVNGKKQVIELFGTYWHGIFDVAKRTEHFRQYGFATLVIWEDELKDTRKVISKIAKFSKAAT